jgi:hypothetical protein
VANNDDDDDDNNNNNNGPHLMWVRVMSQRSVASGVLDKNKHLIAKEAGYFKMSCC